MVRYWIGIASHEHVQLGVKGGFCQLCHGKSAPLKRMKKGDWIIYYSPKMFFQQKQLCQRFVAIGEIIDSDVYQVEMFPGFFPFRRNVEFFPSKECEIKPLINELSFIVNKKNWGYQFRFGMLEIGEMDFNLIKSHMVGYSGFDID